MTERNLKRFIALLGVVVVVYLLTTLIRSRRPPGVEASPLQQAFDRTAADTADRYTITSPAGETVVISREGDGWLVNGYRADSIGVARFLGAIDRATVSNLAATNVASHARLGVAADSTWTLEAAGSDVHFHIGKQGTYGASAFIRMAGAAEVYEVSGELRVLVARDAQNWWDRTIARVDTARVATIRIRRDGAMYTIAREDTHWRVTPPGVTADPVAMATLLETLSDYDASGFPPDTTTFDRAEQRSLVVMAAAGDTLAHVDFTGDDYTWLVRTAADSTIRETGRFLVDRLTPARDSLARGS